MSTTTDSPHVLNNCEHCAELEQRLEQLQIGREIELATLAAQVAQMKQENDRLKNSLAERAKETTRRDREAYEEWLRVHKKDPALKVNAFGPAAQSALTRARRAGLEQEDIFKVIRAHAQYPFLNFGDWHPKEGKRKDKLSDAFRNEDRWGALLELADAPPAPKNPSPHVPKRQEDHYITQGAGRPIDNLYAALERNECNPWIASGGQGSANCPIHDDRDKSFRFKEKPDGSVLMHCFSCSSGFVSPKAFCEAVRIDLELPLTDLYINQRS